MVKARCLALFVVLAFLAGACDLPRLDDQRERSLAQTSSVYASDGSLITDLHALTPFGGASRLDQHIVINGRWSCAIRDLSQAACGYWPRE